MEQEKSAPNKPTARRRAPVKTAEAGAPNVSRHPQEAPTTPPADKQVPAVREPEGRDNQRQATAPAQPAMRKLHEVENVPQELKKEAQDRWGTKVELSASRENGHYTGPVFTKGDLVAQKVGDKSVVVHQRRDVDFQTSENLAKRDSENRLADVNLKISYNGDKAAAHYHDPRRAAMEEVIKRVHRAAEERMGAGTPDHSKFAGQLEEIRTHMVDKYREAKTRAFEQRLQQAAPQRESERQDPQRSVQRER